MPKSLARKFALSSAVALGLVSFAADAEAATLTFVAALSGSAESPPNASPGTGDVTVIFNDVTQMMTIDTMFNRQFGGLKRQQNVLVPPTLAKSHVARRQDFLAGSGAQPRLML